MFKALFGNSTVEKILLYLLVNDECYAHQLHRQLSIPLTPVQKALERLENGGIIRSFSQKNRKLYHFNADYPVIKELEQLLKKPIMNFPLEKKKLIINPKRSSFKSASMEMNFFKQSGISLKLSPE